MSWEVDFDYERIETRKDEIERRRERRSRHLRHRSWMQQRTRRWTLQREEWKRRHWKWNKAVTSPLNEPPSAADNEKNVRNESNDGEIVSRRVADIIAPGISEMEVLKTIRAHRREIQSST